MKTLFRWVIIVVLGVVIAGSLPGSAPLTSQARGTFWTAYVFGNRDLTGQPIWTGPSSGVNYSWGMGAPVINGVPTGAPVDNFSVRFTTQAFFTTGNYRFTIQVDDGMRLYVDGALLLNAWESGLGMRTLQADQNFTTDGNHTITVEMFDAIDTATIIVNWALAVGVSPVPGPGVPAAGGNWSAEFFSNPDLTGAPIYTTTYGPSGLDQNWGTGSPGGGIPADNFSARFTRTITVPTDLPVGTYVFYARADDGFRFIVDVTTIFDHWDFVNETFAAEVTLLDGPHVLRFEYRELSADARVFLTWTPPNAQNPVISPDAAGAPVVSPPAAPEAAAEGAPAEGAPPSAPTGVRGMVMGNLRIRSGPGLEYSRIGLMPWGTQVDLLAQNDRGDWYKVNFEGLIGWAYAPWFRVVQGTSGVLPGAQGGHPVGGPTLEGVIIQAYGNLRIRSGPGLQHPKIGLAVWGTRVQVLGMSPDRRWYKIVAGDLVGWSSAFWYRPVQGDIGAVPILTQ